MIPRERVQRAHEPIGAIFRTTSIRIEGKNDADKRNMKVKWNIKRRKEIVVNGSNVNERSCDVLSILIWISLFYFLSLFSFRIV